MAVLDCYTWGLKSMKDLRIYGCRLPMPGTGKRYVAATWGAILFAILSVSSAAMVSAQTSGAADRIGVGDVIRVDVTGRPDLSVTVTVDDQGGVTLPNVGSMRAAGRTIGEMSADISRRISLTQRETLQVRIAIVEARVRKIFVLGSVLLPGPYSFRQDPSVWDAISEAGGAADDADLTLVEIIPATPSTDRPKTTVNVAAVIQSGKYETMPRLKPGDTVQVPRRGGAAAVEGSIVYIMGAVTTQGAHGLSTPPDLISTVIRSSPTADADFSRIEIVRREGGRVVQMKVNARDYLSEAQPNGNPELRPGDTIYVPHQTRRFNLFSIIGYVSPVIALATSIALLAR
jgi:protein involved in polysaccharide export with SLBB domain